MRQYLFKLFQIVQGVDKLKGLTYDSLGWRNPGRLNVRDVRQRLMRCSVLPIGNYQTYVAEINYVESVAYALRSSSCSYVGAMSEFREYEVWLKVRVYSV